MVVSALYFSYSFLLKYATSNFNKLFSKIIELTLVYFLLKLLMKFVYLA